MSRMLESVFERMLCAAVITLSIPLLGFGQQPNRVVDWQPVRLGSKARVLEIVDIKVEGKSISAGVPFNAGEDWLDTLTFRVRNVPGKTITTFGFGVSFPEIRAGGPTPMFSVVYGDSTKTDPSARKPLLADAEVDLKLPTDQLEAMRDVNTKGMGTSNLSRLNILPGVVSFEDGSRLGGFSLRKLNPETP